VASSDSDLKTYGMMLKNQTWSHLFLIRYIAAALAFEKVKEGRRNQSSDLEQYRVVLGVEELYQNFYSLSW
jgi:hypothetical protein